MVTLLIVSSTLTANIAGQPSKPNALFKQSESRMDALKRLHKKYGTAKLILKNRSVYKRITVHEINSFWIVFLKDGSLHDILIEKISRIQFGNEEGPVVTFNEDNNLIIRH